VRRAPRAHRLAATPGILEPVDGRRRRSQEHDPADDRQSRSEVFSANAPKFSAATPTAVSAIGAARDSVHVGASSACGERGGRTKMAEQPFVATRPATRRARRSLELDACIRPLVGRA
jgi:hypothetical protein